MLPEAIGHGQVYMYTSHVLRAKWTQGRHSIPFAALYPFSTCCQELLVVNDQYSVLRAREAKRLHGYVPGEASGNY
jgi:hypothetical protein